MTLEELRQRYEDELAIHVEREETRAKREFEKVLRKLYKHPLASVSTTNDRTVKLADDFGLVTSMGYRGCIERFWTIRIGPYIE